MSASISKSPLIQKRSINCPVLGEWTCFKRREGLLVLLADVARINDNSPLKDYSCISLNPFMTLWGQVGYMLSASEEDLIETATSMAKEYMRLLPYDDALEFITQHLARPGKLLLKIFDPKIQGHRKPTTQTIILEPLEEEDGEENGEKSPGEGIDRKTRLRVAAKRGESPLNGSSGFDESAKKRKMSNSDGSCTAPSSDDMFIESFVAFTKTFLGKKQCQKDELLEKLEEEKQARKNAEEKINELKVQFKQQLDEEKKVRKMKDEEIQGLKDELQMTKNKRQALEDKLQGIKQFLQMGTDKRVNVSS